MPFARAPPRRSSSTDDRNNKQQETTFYGPFNERIPRPDQTMGYAQCSDWPLPKPMLLLLLLLVGWSVGRILFLSHCIA